ncbi:MOSC domain-containing protein YiiM [Devosia sp. YR412]|uniref:MOSC domain-containing protein n=1 Tax=Devosia sp. YR412 TaxID=1881030 RepID=UPI0008AC0E00|nr:MOSC domain-containing protein [Devosia sp. YR412]SEQ28476.1 MOSC domain-containing protein YiiM [Devosia sp. YR412]
MPELLSVNHGTARHIEGYKPLTGIIKTPVQSAVIDRMGLSGDAVCDRKHHGGVDQAVYVYFADDYQYWADQLGRSIEPGWFGDNLTISGVEGRSVAIGDRFAMGPVELEVTYHRTPCMTFAALMGDPMWVKKFHRAGRPGAYCRVLTPGTVEPGMDVIYTPFAGERITVSELMALDVVKQIDPAFMRRALTTPIREKTRFKFEDKLASLF